MFAHSLRTNISSYRTVALRLSPELYLVSTECQKGRSQWPSGRGSEAARLLRLRVRIPPGTWMSVVSIVCSQVEVSATDRSLVQRSPTDCTLETKPTQHVWTDSGRRSRNQPRYCLCRQLQGSDCLAQASGFISSRQSGQTPAAVFVGFESCCNGQNAFNLFAPELFFFYFSTPCI